MALHASPTMALHGLSVQFCFVVVAYLVTVHVHVAIMLLFALAEGLRVDAIVWLLQHLELFVSSFPSLGFQGRSPTEACNRHCFGWSWWSVRYSPLRLLIDRSACLVEPSLLFRAPCCPAASTFAARESPSRGLVVRSCLSCFLRAALVIAVDSPRFPSLFTWHFRVLTRSAHLPTRSTQVFSFWTLYSQHGSVNLELLACLRHQMLLICWHVLLVLGLGFVLSMANSALNSSS